MINISLWFITAMGNGTDFRILLELLRILKIWNLRRMCEMAKDIYETQKYTLTKFYGGIKS